MGSIAARKCYTILNNLKNVISIELMTAAQALEFLKPLKPGIGTSAAYKEIRKAIKPVNNDRFLHLDLKKILDLVKNDVILNAVKEKVKIN